MEEGKHLFHNSTCSDIAVNGLKAEIKSLQETQRPVNSEVEELKKALQATKNVMEYKETEEEHAAYKKVKYCVFKQLNEIKLVAE